ncbi:hypothetical protein CVS47_00362 [Microbacterium lemovicicum]|uniref:Uncharacterized protein n=1 Tax=Microbacterium lemovicicum TaxID=1072463 RepID=A0A3S9W6Z0_9MICO|nr:hypothetical protein CVS47_00362 [Microbacterium lemovicicum]
MVSSQDPHAEQTPMEAAPDASAVADQIPGIDIVAGELLPRRPRTRSGRPAAGGPADS